MHNRFIFRSAVLASTACILAAPAAFAQEAPAQEAPAETTAQTSGEIVVTGQRQQYRGNLALKEIPQNIQIMSSELLEDAGITRLDTALDLASGVARQNNFGGLWDAFAIRGFAGDENFPSGFLVNGFNGGRGYGGPRDASNVERIEVLKGPNGALFGRGEPGGTVNIVTKKPQFDAEGSFAISGGSFETFRVEADVTAPITSWLAFRVNGASEHAGSFRDTIESRKYVASPSLLAKFSDSTSLSYEMEYVNQEVPFDRGVVAVNGVLGAIPRSRFLGEPGDGPLKVEVLGHQVQFQHDFSKNWSLLLGFGYKDTTFTGYSTEAELALGRQILDNNGTHLARQRRFRDYSTQHMVFRGELSGELDTFGLTHNLIIGADWDKFDIDLFQQRYRPPAYVPGSPITAANNAINIFAPVYGSMPAPNATITNSLEVQKAWGIYLQDQIELTDNLKLRLGGRYDDFRQNITTRIVGVASPKPAKYTKFSPTVGLVFEPTNTLSLYASYGKGFRPNTGVDFTNTPFTPETSLSYEVGAKYTSRDGRITSTISLFKTKKDNVLTADLVNQGFSAAVGKARSQGVEFDFTGKLPGGFQVYLTYAYTDAEWAQDALDPNFGLAIREGDPLINIPKHSANLLFFKDFELGEGKITLGGGVNYVSKRLGETGTQFFLPGYTLAKAFVAWEPRENIRLSAEVSNIFDEEYYVSSYAQYWVAPGAPRAFTVRAGFRF